VAENGELKIRGIECRRHDTPPVVSRMQHQVLEILAEAHDFKSYCHKLEEARRTLDRYLDRLADGSMDVEDLIISKRLTRAPEAYRKDTATAVVAPATESLRRQAAAGRNHRLHRHRCRLKIP